MTKRLKSKAILYIVLFFVVVAVAVAFALRASPRHNPQKQDGSAGETQTYRKRLDGVLIRDAGATTTPVVAIVIDDAADAQPTSGVAAASVVFELPVEGPITRLLALYPSDADVPEIGPVRSARPYMADMVKEYNAMFAHVGGSPAGLERIGVLNLRDLNEFSYGRYFWRSARPRPHNVYTSMDQMRQALGDRKFDAPPDYAPWQWKDDAPGQGSEAPQGWTYEPWTNEYRRTFGEAVGATNVVLMETDVATIDEVLRKRIRTTGEGKASVYHDGRVTVGSWKKKTPASRLRFYHADGVEVQFNAGLTWITVGATR